LLGRDPGQDALELDEATGAGGEIADDQQRPLVTDEVEGPGVRSPLVIWMTLGRRNGGNGRLLRGGFGSLGDPCRRKP
jgi:hypothetical protein